MEEDEYLSDKNKLIRLRQWCKDNQPISIKFVNFGWILGHIMGEIKYGEGFEMEDLLEDK